MSDGCVTNNGELETARGTGEEMADAIMEIVDRIEGISDPSTTSCDIKSKIHNTMSDRCITNNVVEHIL